MLARILSSLAALVTLTPRRGLLLGLALAPALAVAALVGALVYAVPAGRPPAPAGGAAQAGTTLPAPGGLLVEVSGAVVHPGMYRVAKGERASAAIAAAGGITADADPTRLPNLAARLKDGQQINVPSRTSPGRSSGGAWRVARVSLNTATAEQLATLPGFTPELTAAVMRYRTEYGGFTTTQELIDALGMSQADYALARRYIAV